MILLNKAKNYIANGAFDFWQRNTTFTSIASGAYCADRFSYEKNGTMVHNISRDTDVPTLAQASFVFPYSLSMAVATAQASIGANNYAILIHKIEGQMFSSLHNRKMNLTFWIKGSVTGTFSVSFSDSIASRSYVSNYTINSANTWEKKTISLTHNNTGTWNTGAGIGAYINFCFACGTTTASINTWQAGNFLAGSGISNGVATNGTTFKITGIQLEEGSEPSNFERMAGTIDNEFKLCQRYYEKSYIADVPPGTAFTVTNSNPVLTFFPDTSAYSRKGFNLKFSAEKRAIPTFVNYSLPGSANSVSGYNSTGASSSYDINSGTSIAKTTLGISTAGHIDIPAFPTTNVSFNWTADAEL